MSSQAPPAHTFIVRVWQEPRGAEAGGGEWRGEVQHVPSGRRTHFREIGSVAAVLTELIRAGATE